MASTSSGVGGDGGGLKAELGAGVGGGSVGVVRLAREQQNPKSLGVCTALKKVKRERGSTAKERISKMPPCTAGKRSSIYRGVTRHRWTGRYEAHLWDKSTWNENQNKKGKQVYLGAYDDEEAAARAYDLAALKYWGPGTLINFPVTDYSRDLEEMQNISREEYLASLRRKSSGFSRGISKYRGLSSSRWESSLGHSSGSEYLNSMQYGVGDDAALEGEYVGGLCAERKIDLTGYIKWWNNSNKTRQGDPLSKSSDKGIEDGGPAASELKSLERAILSTEPYQMPQLGTSYGAKKNKNSPSSALSILSKCPAYKHMQERALKAKETIIIHNDENENKSNINKIDHGKAIEKTTIPDSGIDRLGTSAGAMSLPKYPLSPLLSAPLLTSYSSVDPLVDPALWTSLMPVLPSAPSQTTEITESERSPFTIFRQEEG